MKSNHKIEEANSFPCEADLWPRIEESDSQLRDRQKAGVLILSIATEKNALIEERANEVFD